MFDEVKWHLLLSLLLRQPIKGDAHEIRTKARSKLNRFNIKNSTILVTTNRTHYKNCIEVPKYMFEKVYNKLKSGLTLSQKQISTDLNIKRSAFVITAISLLPEIEYDRASNSLKFTGLSLRPNANS